MKVILLAMVTSLIPAHSWYDKTCCGDSDCHPVPCEELSELSNGDWKWQSYLFEKYRIRPSQDKSCHICLHPTGIDRQPMCLYIQFGT